jgi:type VI protein secretion system component VasF
MRSTINKPQEQSELDNDRRLPSRRMVHNSEKGKWTRLFYQILLLLFILLIVFLIGWFGWFKKPV